MKRYVHLLKKTSTIIWNHAETIKTVVIISLVVLSILLTLQLWTYQPDLQLLEKPESVDVGVIQKGAKDYNEVIKPNQIVYIDGNKHYVSYVASNNQKFYSELLNGPLDNGRTQYIERQQVRPKTAEFELNFHTSIPTEVLHDMFKFDTSNALKSSLGDVERIFIWTDKNIVKVRFVGNNVIKKGSYKGHTEVKDFQITRVGIDSLLEKLKSRKKLTLVEPFSIKGNKEVYLPVKSIEVKNQVLTDSSSYIDAYLTALLDNYSKISLPDNRTLYHDGGSETLIYNHQKKDFGYTSQHSNSNKSLSTLSSNSDVIQQSVNFINAHSAWTGNYNLYGFLQGSTSNQFKQVLFRLDINGFPLMQSAGEINLTWTSDGQLINYERSAIRYYALGSGNAVRLANAATIKKALKEEQSDIDDITIGYSGDANPQFLKPQWYYRMENKWVPVEQTPTGG